MTRFQNGALLGVGVVIVLAVLSPSAMAATTVDRYDGSNVIYSSGSCTSWIIAPVSPTYTYTHTSGDSVDLPMRNKYTDLRSAGSPGRYMVSNISLVYNGTTYNWGGLTYYSTGNANGYQSGTYSPGFPVYDGTSMNVTYSAQVEDRSTTPISILCSHSQPVVTYNFV